MPPSRRSVRSLVLLLATVLAVPLVALLGAAPAQAVSGALSGTVVDALDAPLTGVTVQARNATTSAVVTSVDTGGTNAYSLPVADGSYTIWFVKAGYTSEPLGGTEDPITVVVTGGIAFIDGDPVTDNDLGSFTLVSTSTRTVSGTVTAGGSGYQDVVVRAFLDEDDETVVASATSAANGSYSLALPLGKYFVEYVAPTPRSPQYANTYYPGTTPGTLVTVQAGAEPLVLNSVALTAIPSTQKFPILGRAVDANGDGITGLTVQIVPISPSTDSAQTSTTGSGVDAGEFTASVQAGNYQVTFSGTGYVGTTFPGGGDPTATVTVAGNGSLSVNGTPVPSGRLDSVEVPSTGHSVPGRVIAAGGSTGIAGISVRAVASDGSGTPVTATTVSDGTYTLSLPIGSWLVDFTDADGVDPQYAGAVLGGGTGKVVKVGQGTLFYGSDAGTGLPTPVTTLPDQALAPSDANTAYDVLGDLDDANGDPVPGITVTATPTSGSPVTSAPSNADGRYTLPLKAGTYRLRTGGTADFAAADYTHTGTTAVDVVVSSNGTVTVTTIVGGTPTPDAVPLRLLQPIELVGLISNYTVTGKAVSAPSTGIAGITATAFLDSDSTLAVGTSAATVGTGTYTLNTLKIGTYLVRLTDTNGAAPLYNLTWFTKNGAGSSTPENATSVKVAQGGIISVDGTVVTTLTDTLMTQATDNSEYDVPGSVSDANNDPLPGVTVTASGTATKTTTTDVDGKYILKLKPGSYSISFGKTDFATTSYPSPTVENAAATITVELGNVIKVVGADPEIVTLLDDVTLAGTKDYALAGRIVGPGDVNPGPVTVQVADSNSTTFTTVPVTIGADGSFTNLNLKVGTYKIRFLDATPDTAPIYVLATYPKPIKIATGGTFFTDEGNAYVPLTPTGTLAKVTFVAATADARYDLVGTTSDWDGESLNGVLVEAVDTGTGAVRASTTTGPDTVTGLQSLGNAGVYRLPVNPGRYWLRFSKAGLQTSYLPSFDDDQVRVVITVSLTGLITASEEDIIDTDNVITDMVVYFPAPTMKTAPKLTGKPLAGQTVTATTGSWDVKKIEDWATFEWFLDGKPADQYSSGKLYEKFEIPAKAIGQDLSFRLRLDDPDFKQAPGIFTSKPVAVKGLKAKLKSSFKKGVLTVKVSVKGLKKLSGKITVLDGKKKVGKGTLSVKAKGVVTIKLKLKPGKHKLLVVFTGPKGSPTGKDKIKVKV